MSIATKPFGKTKDGKEVTLYEITNKNDMTVSFLDLGAVIVNLVIPDKNGKRDDIVLGYDNVAQYEENGASYGAFLGRQSNRVAGASFTINGETYHLEKNDGNNCLHSGHPGFHRVMYKAETTDNSITFSRISPDGEQGFPGNLTVSVTYTVTDDNELQIDYKAVSDKDTLCNLTNHSYFNLKGHDGGTILDHEVTICANGFTETSDELIPTGKIVDVTGTPMDFRKKKALGKEIGADYKPLHQGNGYDHNFVLDKGEGVFGKAAEVSEVTSGRKMEVYTDLPGMQMYAGNFIGSEPGKNGVTYENRTGVCFETQLFPNSMHIPEFKSSLLKAGEEFQSRTVYKFSWN